MFKKLSIPCLFLFVLITALPVAVFAYVNPGSPTGFVNDFAGVLNVEQKQQLEQKLSGFEKSTGNEISIAVIKNLGGDTVENFAVELFKDWKIGKKDKDNGALILVAIDDREMRIEVGYGLEGVLTDAQSSWIINNEMVPAFRDNDFYGGLNTATDKIISAIGGEVISEDKPAAPKVDYFNILAFVIFVFVWLGSILGRSKSWWAGGVVGGIAGIIIGFIKGFLYFGVISLAILIPLGLLFDFIASKTYSKSKSQGKVPPWWIGGGGFGSGSKGGGFGGFGGFGGGSSGGGGASGRW